MAVTYVYATSLNIKVPKLHTIRIPIFVSYADMHRWCLENCKASFYILPSWSGNGCQFEDDNDALLFALRWC